MDHDHLQTLRRSHPAWRLLAADSAPLVAGFLHHCFIEPNVRVLAEQDLAARLDDYLYHLRETLGDGAYPRAAMEYLRDWADDSRGWLRRYYPPDSDEAHYDLTPGAEQAIQWLAGLEQRQFVGAESRLKLIFDLLLQIERGSETDPEARIAELRRRQQALEAEIDEIRAGRLAFMDDTQLRERFLQVRDTARALLADFRQVEQNFRELDRQVRERIATWRGSRGEVLAEVFGERDQIADSDQGRSFRAFWDLLMSPARQEELTCLLENVLSLEPVAALDPDPRLKRIHYDWLAAGELAQRTVARLSEQLRRYLDDRAWLENRRIIDVIREVERHALALRDAPPSGSLMTVDASSPEVNLPFERPLFSPPPRRRIDQDVVQADGTELAADALFEQVYVDKDRLRAHLRRALQSRPQVSLSEILDAHPLEHGLAELVAWLSLATGESPAAIDESVSRRVSWSDANGVTRTATIPEVVFIRPGTPAVGAPAVGTPPAGTPPAGTPPAGTPPAGTPATGTPPAGTPPAGTPPVGTPPVGTPPVGTPPVGTPPVGADSSPRSSGESPTSGQSRTGVRSYTRTAHVQDRENTRTAHPQDTRNARTAHPQDTRRTAHPRDTRNTRTAHPHD